MWEGLTDINCHMLINPFFVKFAKVIQHEIFAFYRVSLYANISITIYLFAHFINMSFLAELTKFAKTNLMEYTYNFLHLQRQE